MRLPDFLIVGAMKAGTTGLFRDLALNPHVFMPSTKEPEGFVDDSVLETAGLDAYATHFSKASPDQVVGEASTAYTKLPEYPGVPGRAFRVVPEAKIIYLVREPVARVVSHHQHGVMRGTMPDDLDAALEVCPELIDYTRYSMQIEPWLDRYQDRVTVVRFEDYATDRRATVARIGAFLEIPPRTELIDESVVYNRSSDVRIAGGALTTLTKTDWYRRNIQGLLPRAARDRLRSLVGRKRPGADDRPSDHAIAAIRRRLADDLARLPDLVGDQSLRW